jgi:hypothetical protein
LDDRGVELPYNPTVTSEQHELAPNRSEIGDSRFWVTLVSFEPATFTIENPITGHAVFDYSNLRTMDSSCTKHRPTLAPEYRLQLLELSESISRAVEFGASGRAPVVSHECQHND